MYDDMHQHLRQMLDLDVIRPSNSPWTSNVVLVRKPNGELRFCIDLRWINQRSVADAYYLPRIDETLDTLAGAKYVTSFDLKSGYWQVEMEEDAKQYTAFTVGPLGFYGCNRMPFGLKNAPATFQRLMQRVLGDLHLNGCVVYIDDIVIYSKTEEEHEILLRKVFQKIREAGMKLSPKKCRFFQREIKCLGHVVSVEGISCDPSKTAAVSTWPVPTTVKDVQKFLGFTGFYRRFIKDYAKVARPLTELLRGSNPRKKTGKKVAKTVAKTKWKWGEDQDKAFQALIKQLTGPPVLCYPDFSKPFLLRTDASKQGLGAVLCQEQESGDVRVVAYGSRTLRKAEENYSTHKLEFWALYWAVTKQFHHYLLWCPQLRGHHRSQPSHVCTNHCQAGCCGAQMDGRPRRLQLCCQLQAREAQLWCRRSFKTSHWSSLFISQCSIEPRWLHSRVSHHKRWSEWRNHRVTHSVTGREMEWGAAERSCPEWGDSTSQDWKEAYKGGAIAVESGSPAFPEWVVQTQCAWRCHLPQEGEPRWRRVLATAMPCAVSQSHV